MLRRSTAYLLALVVTFSCTPAFAGWTKSLEKDAFDDNVFNLWFFASRSSGGGKFVFGCDNEGKLSVYWEVGKEQSEIMAMDMGVVIRLDSDPSSEEEWRWTPAQATIRPKDAAEFLKRILPKKKMAIKTSLGGDVGIFDISGANKAYQEAKSACKLK